MAEINENKGGKVEGLGYGLVIAVLCMLTYGVSFVSRQVWSASIASESTLSALGITALEAGGIATAFYVGYVISNFFSGFLVDSFGPRITLAATALGTGAATLLIPFTSGYPMMFALRVLAGLFAGPLFAGCSKMNYGWFSDKVRAAAVGFIMSGPAVGNAIASIAFTPMVASKGYKVAFIWAGIATIAVGVIGLVFLKEKGLAKASMKEKKTAEEKKADTMDAIKVFTKKDFLIGSVMHMIIVGAGMGYSTWILAYLIQEKGLSAAAAGALFGSSQLLGLVSGTLSGVVSDLLKTRKWLLIASSVVACTCFILFTKVTSLTVLTVLAFVTQLSNAFTGNPSNAMQTERAKGPNAGKVMGWYNAICQLGSVIYPTLTGAVIAATGRYEYVLYTIGFSYLFTGILCLLVKDTYVKS